jgi:hypothetical protein
MMGMTRIHRRTGKGGLEEKKVSFKRVVRASRAVHFSDQARDFQTTKQAESELLRKVMIENSLPFRCLGVHFIVVTREPRSLEATDKLTRFKNFIPLAVSFSCIIGSLFLCAFLFPIIVCVASSMHRR